MTLIGISLSPPLSDDRVPVNVHPRVLQDLIKLLYEPEFHAVGYSEFIRRAITTAQGEIYWSRKGVRDLQEDGPATP